MSSEDRDYMIERARARDREPRSGSPVGLILLVAVVVAIVLVGLRTGQQAPVSPGMAGTWLASPAVPFPENASVHVYRYSEAQTAPFKVIAKGKSNENSLVRVFDAQTREPVFDIYVRGGQEAEIPVPLGSYRMVYTQGTTWYGPDELFGNNAAVTETTGPLELRQGRSLVIELNTFAGNTAVRTVSKSALGISSAPISQVTIRP
jgi:hypothetical protein